MNKKSAVFFFAVLFVFTALFAAADDGIVSSTELELTVSTRPEAKIGLIQSFTFPFLRGSGPLTSGNNLKTSLTFEAAPVFIAGIGQFVWTPIAFLEISGGGQAGSGWNLPVGYGIGLNVPIGSEGSGPGPKGERESEIDAKPFDGLQWKLWAGGAFQFDLAAVVPGEWNHVQFRAYSEMKYWAYTRAGKGDSWIIQSDDGDNMNGWVWSASFVLGYAMPLSPVLNFVGFMAEADRNLYDITKKADWGGNMGRWIFSGLFNFDIVPGLSAMMAIQMRTRPNYGTSDFENDAKLWYQDLKVQNDGGNRKLVFYRAALIVNWKIR